MAYNWLDPLRRQLCWAHLRRDFQAMVDRGSEDGRNLRKNPQAGTGTVDVRDSGRRRADEQ